MDFSDAFELAATIEFIRNSDLAGHEVKGKHWLLDSLKSLLESLDVCEFEDVMIYEDILEWIKKLERNYKKGQKISKKDGKELSKDAYHWDQLIFREMSNRPCIEFQKGALNQKALVNTSKGKSSNIFDKRIWKALPKIAKSDFADAAKCLLVGASTPATMVALRGMEAVVRKYYASKTNKPVGKKNLGAIINELQKVPKVNEKLLSYIDYIRSEKRNIAQHPTKVFTQREAERIFMEIVSATHDIYDAILRSEVKRVEKK